MFLCTYIFRNVLPVHQLERAYDKVMMSQLTSRKKGLAFGAFQVCFFHCEIFIFSFNAFLCRLLQLHDIFTLHLALFEHAKLLTSYDSMHLENDIFKLF